MKTEKELRNLKIKIAESEKRYIIRAMEFRRRILEEKEKAVKSRKKKKFYIY